METVESFNVPLCAVYRLSRPDESERAEETATQAEDGANSDEVAEEKRP